MGLCTPASVSVLEGRTRIRNRATACGDDDFGGPVCKQSLRGRRGRVRCLCRLLYHVAGWFMSRVSGSRKDNRRGRGNESMCVESMGWMGYDRAECG